jgi:hypothetical protein
MLVVCYPCWQREGIRSALDLSCQFGHHQLGGVLFQVSVCRLLRCAPDLGPPPPMRNHAVAAVLSMNQHPLQFSAVPLAPLPPCCFNLVIIGSVRPPSVKVQRREG